ncbi:MAG: hypothetical protein SVR04_14955, partial [Spirochaetota bacterium]|nr:hypothetical protein [Spirochaetota bacterium]
LMDKVAAIADTPASEINLKVEEWEESFAEEFEAGLGKWEQAEKQFMQARINWELNSQEEYEETEEAWDDAFTQFALARSAWAGEISTLLQEGKDAWDQKEANFSSDFTAAVSELTTAAESELTKFKNEINQALASYRSTIDMAAMADEYLSYYQHKMETTELDAEYADFKREYEAWENIRETALEARRSAEKHLYDLEAFADRYGSDHGKYSVAAGSYEGEVARLERRVDYLADQLAVSEAVLAYAEDESSLRDTEAETEAECTAAELALEAARANYDASEKALQDLLEEMARLQGQMLECNENEITPAKEELQKARELFENAWTVYTANDTDLLRSIIGEMEDEIAAYYLENGRYDLYYAYFTAAEARDRSAEETEREVLIRDLHGNEGPSEADTLPDTPRLEADLAKLEGLDLDWENWDADLFSAALIEAGYTYDQEKAEKLRSLFTRGRGTGGAAALARIELEAELSLYRSVLEEGLQHNRALETLLLMDSFETWGGETGYFAHLAEQVRAAEDLYLAGKAQIINDAFALSVDTTGEMESYEAAEILSESISELIPDRAERRDLADKYALIASLFQEVAAGSVSRQEAVSGLPDDHRSIFLDFAAGNGPAVRNGFDLCDLFLGETRTDLLRAQAEMNSAGSYHQMTIPANKNLRTARTEQLSALFAEEPLIGDTDDVLSCLSQMYAAGYMPEYFEERVISYMAASVKRDGIELEAADEIISTNEDKINQTKRCLNMERPDSIEELALLISLSGELGLTGNGDLLLLAAAGVIEDTEGEEAAALESFLGLCGLSADTL